MRYGWTAIAGLLACTTAALAAPTNDVAALGWLSGNWVSETKQGWTEEHWTPPRGGVMMGVNRSGQGETANAFEFMRIAPVEGGALSYWAWPNGKAPAAFRLVSSSADEAVFENPNHDYPTRIVYRRKGDTLIGTISGPNGTKPYSWTFKRR